MDTLRAARYPFLADARQLIGESGIEVDSLLTGVSYESIRERGMARVEGALKDHTIPDISLMKEIARQDEVLSYLYARMLVSAVNDRLLTQRYALAEAERMNKLLSADPTAMPAIIDELEINAHNNKDGTVSMHFADYLRFSYVMRASEWKLINMDLREGYVRLERDKFVRLLQNAYRLRIESELPLKIPDEFYKLMRTDTDRVGLMLMQTKDRLSPTGGQGMKDEYLPPCIKTIIAMAQSGQNLPHSARFTLVSYLHALGLNYEQIVSIFAVSPDFDESVSEYQIKHITGELNGGEGYTPPTCSFMKTNGLCFEPEELCEKIKHPLSYYRIKSGKKFEDRKE